MFALCRINHYSCESSDSGSLRFLEIYLDSTDKPLRGVFVLAARHADLFTLAVHLASLNKLITVCLFHELLSVLRIEVSASVLVTFFHTEIQLTISPYLRKFGPDSIIAIIA